MKTLIQYGILICSIFVISCSRNTPSYESKFEDSVEIDFPGGRLAGNADSIRSRMDEYLRSDQQGFVSGVMTDGVHIDSMTLDVDLDHVNPRELIDMFVSKGILPEGVKVEIRKIEQDRMRR